MYQSPVYEKYLQKQDKKSKTKSTNLYNVLADEQSIVPQDNTVSRDGFFDIFRRKKNNKTDENNIHDIDEVNEVNEVVSINDDNDDNNENNENNNVIEFDDEPELEVYPSEESSSEIVSSDTPFQDMNEMNYQHSTEDNDLQYLLDELNNANSEDFETTLDTETTQNNYQSRPVLKSGTSRYIENLRKYYD